MKSTVSEQKHYIVELTLSQFSGNLNYFPFVDCKGSRGSALMPIKVNGRFCINSPESWIRLVFSCKAFKLCFSLSYVKVRFTYWQIAPVSYRRPLLIFHKHFEQK